jgi:hypothetical protein
MVAVEMGRAGSFSYPDFLDLQDRGKSFAGLTAFAFAPVSLTGTGKPERIWATMVTANYFEVLGVKPALGRGFLPGEDRSPNGAAVAIISDRLWQQRFGADPTIVGQTIHLNTRQLTIVGVTPPVFQGSTSGLRFDLWVPVTSAQSLAEGGKEFLVSRGDTWLDVLGHLSSARSRERAQSEATPFPTDRGVAGFAPRREPNHPLSSLARTERANGFSPRLANTDGCCRGCLAPRVLQCCKLSALRGLSRQKEMCVRLSLGAGRFRLIRRA